MFRVLVNWADWYSIASGEEAGRLCGLLGGLPAFMAHVVGPTGESGLTLDVIVESDRGLVAFLDIGRGIKMGSWNPGCMDREIVSLRNDAYPELGLEQVEVERRDVIPPAQAIAILRHFLTTGEVVGLVTWPDTDWDDRPAAAPKPMAQQGEETPF